jgi:predicted dehydrogenase
MESGMRKIRLGMVGGGIDAFIGAVHRIAARLDGDYELVAGALSSSPQRASESGRLTGLPPDRIYSDFREMARAEAARPDGVEVVSIVTPNHLHFPVAKAFLEHDIHVICDKPLTATLKDALALQDAVRASNAQFMLTHNYTGYPMAREARRLVADGRIGTVRLVQMEYIQDWLAYAGADNKQAAWRLDPDRSGVGGCIGDIGTHAYNLGLFISGLEAIALSADLQSFAGASSLDDNAHILFRFQGGAKGMLWSSQIAIGNENCLRLRVIGDKGSLEFNQEAPNQLWLAVFGQPKQLLTRGGHKFSGVARIPSGHPEGFLEAFATLYHDFAGVIRGGPPPSTPLPDIQSGISGMEFIVAAVRSHTHNGAWTDL